MIELRVDIDPELTDALSSCLFDAGAGGVTEQEGDEHSRLVVYCQDADEAARLQGAIEIFRDRARSAFPDAHMGTVVQTPLEADWQSTWLEALRPARLTDSIVLRPLHAAPAPEGEETLWFEPASCFGSGDHPTTRLAARVVEQRCLAQAATESILRVLDVGTGTGVLCFVALRRGAQHAVGIDIDEVAVEAAQRNAELNELASMCHFSAVPVAELDETYELVVANIDAVTLQALAPDLLARLAPGGTLYVTGLLEEQEQEVSGRFTALGARVELRETDGDWVLLGLVR